MPEEFPARRQPRWSELYDTAAAQEGHFTAAQAAEAGYYPQLLQKYLQNGRIIRVRRGIYRLVHFPPGDHEDLVVIWLWADRLGLFSHETALALHELSDAMPARVHLTVPEAWKRRRLRVPEQVSLHYADVADSDRAWVGAVELTGPARTVVDCAVGGVAPDLVRQAIDEGVHRGLFTERMVAPAIELVRSFAAQDP